MSEREVVTLLLGLAALAFALSSQHRLRLLPGRAWLLTALALAVAGWVSTVTEAYVQPAAVNVIEHLCYAASAIVLLGWSRIAFRRPPS